MSKTTASEFDFDAMVDLWTKGQQAFFKSQTEMARGFAETVTSESPEAAQEATMAAWANMFSPYAQSGFNPAALFDPCKFASMSNAFGADPITGSMAGASNPMAMFAFMDPKTWANSAPDQMRDFLKNIASGPRFADLATPQVEAAEVWRETLDYQTAAADFATVLQSAWTKAMETFGREYSVEDLQEGNAQEALDAWLKAANAALLECQHSDAFMDAQRRLLRAGMEIQARQKDIAEQWSAAYQMPTRTEIDDLTKIVHELRRDLRATKRELAALKSADTEAPNP